MALQLPRQALLRGWVRVRGRGWGVAGKVEVVVGAAARGGLKGSMQVIRESPPTRQNRPEAPAPDPLRQFRAVASAAAAAAVLEVAPLRAAPKMALLL